jgi:hypothetical protein
MRKYLDLEVSLLDIDPRIWRRVLLAQTSSFEDLHEAIQGSFGWEFDHLFEFREPKGRRTIAGAGLDDPYADEEAPHVGKLKLAAFLTRKGRKCIYVYDFGDNWEHLVEFHGIVESPEKFKRRLVDGARACPLEDCGGVWGYYACCAAVGAIAPKEIGIGKEDLEDRKEWVGDEWHPDKFDLGVRKKAFDR